MCLVRKIQRVIKVYFNGYVAYRRFENHFTAKIPIEMPQNPDWVYFE